MISKVTTNIVGVDWDIGVKASHEGLYDTGNKMFKTMFYEKGYDAMFCEKPVEGEFIRWQSAVVPEKSKGEKVTFIIASGMGANLGEGSHELCMNGRKILEIVTSYGTIINWKSELATGKFETTYIDPHNDLFGIFSVTVNPEIVEYGKSQKFEMKGKTLSSGYVGWFSVCKEDNLMNLNVRELQSSGNIADKIDRIDQHLTPEISREIIANPGIGFVEYGDVCANDADLAKYSKHYSDPAGNITVAYYRWWWAQIEPEQGKYNWGIIDWALARVERRGQQLMLGIMPHCRMTGIPSWYKGKLTQDTRGVAPDYNDVYFREHTAELVKRFGERYDGHPGIYAVDIRIVGHYGEGGSKWATDIYLNAFRKTPLMVYVDPVDSLSYAVSKGTGWRADGFGDLSPGRSHMRNLYPWNIVAASASDAWKKGPVSFETCWNIHYWHKNKWDIDYILEEAVRWHASTINPSFYPVAKAVPDEWREKVDNFTKRIGYRFELRHIYFPRLVRHGRSCAIRQWWVNVGNAPLYHDYRVILRLRNKSKTIFHETGTDLKSWLPGNDYCINSSIQIPPEYPEGDYELSIGIARPGSRVPAVIPANKNVSDDKWLQVGFVKITK